jgi:UDP-N-acetylmuramoylalanine--D-glutamate ligase
MGLGLHGGGVGVAKFFCQQGAKVLVTDLKTKEQLQESLNKLRGLKIEYILGRHRQEDFINTDLVIKNPAVPRESYFLKVAAGNKIPVKSDISIFFDLYRVQIVGVTGTKGKSTVATLIYNLLKTKYPKTILAGNIGISPLESVSMLAKKSIVVLELSSFELEDLRKSPQFAVVTNIFPDHLDRYKDMKEYVESKTPIFKYQRKKDILVLNYDNQEARKFSLSAPSKVYFYSKENTPKDTKTWGCYLKEGQIFFRDEKDSICDINKINLPGEHNMSHALASSTIAKILGVSSEKIKKVLSSFKGVPFRQEFIKAVRGVKYFNDTAATMPDAAVVAIRTFSGQFAKSRIILIAGGQDKGLDYKEMIKEINKTIKNLILLPGTASDKIKEGINNKVNLIEASSMEEAVEKAASITREGDAILLSPGAASFNLFKNEFDRGRKFNEAVERLILSNKSLPTGPLRRSSSEASGQAE